VTQNRRVHHLSLEREDSSLVGDGGENPRRPVDVLVRRCVRLPDHRDLAGMDADLDVESDGDGVDCVGALSLAFNVNTGQVCAMR